MLRVHVTPRSGRDAVVGWRGDALAVCVRAVPEDGRANEAVRRVVSGALGVPKSRVRVARGTSSREKLLEIDAAEARIEEVFGTPPGESGPGR